MGSYTKIIHFMWIDPNNPDVTEPPSNVPSFISEWTQKHPDWSFMFWNLTKCKDLFKSVIELQPLYAKVFDEPWVTDPESECYSPKATGLLYWCMASAWWMSKNEEKYTRMCIADVCRVAVIYAYGGVYMDLSVKPLRGLDLAWTEHPNRSTLFCMEPKENNWYGRICLNSLLGSRFPKNSWWLGFLEYIIKSKFMKRVSHKTNYDPVTITGPRVLFEWSMTAEAAGEEPLSSCAFARKGFVGKITDICVIDEAEVMNTVGGYYAEKLWANSSNWGSSSKFYIPLAIVAPIVYGIVLFLVLCFIAYKCYSIAHHKLEWF
jgi:hypothetical protein